MRRLAALVIVLAGIPGGCSGDIYAPYDFKRVPGYTPAGGVSSPARLTDIPLESHRP